MHYGYKVWSEKVEIEPGTTKRVSVALTAMSYHIVSKLTLPVAGSSDMAFVPELGTAYVAHPDWMTKISVYQTYDSNIAWQRYIEVGAMGHGNIAASQKANRIYVACWDTIRAVNLSTETLIKKIITPRSMGYTRIVFSRDGNWAITADSTDKSLGIIDTKTDSVVRYIDLGGKPTDVTIDPLGQYLYATCYDIQRFLKINFQSGIIEGWLPTGAYSGAIFNDNGWNYLGFCNMGKSDLSFNPVDIDTWALISGCQIAYGEVVRGACFSGDGAYVWVLTTNLPILDGDPHPLPYGYIVLIYLSSWQPVVSMDSNQYPTTAYQSPDGKYLYILGFYDIMIFRTDTE